MKRDDMSAVQATDQAGRARAHATSLPPGTRVGEVEVMGVIGEGSAGIVYLAVDPSLQRRVAVKEYLPSALAFRRAGGEVGVRDPGLADAFRAGLAGFVAEARLLARFEHPALVKVFRVWEANGTAYLAMPYYEGPTLARHLAGAGAAPDEAALRALLMPLLEALEMIHGAGQLHRDISADNILMTPTGPVLLDFGVARRAIDGLTHAPTVVLKRGYAPIEQYAESDALRPGPWSDLYALGCVLHLAITGEPPTISVERLWDDWLEPVSASARGRFGVRLLDTVDALLAVRPADRPQDVAAVRRLLEGDGGPATASAPVAMPTVAVEGNAVAAAHASPTAIELPWPASQDAVSAVAVEGSRRGLLLACVALATAMALALGVRAWTAPVEQAEKPRAAAAMPAPTPVSRGANEAAGDPAVVPMAPVQRPAMTPTVAKTPASSRTATTPRSAPMVDNPAAIAPAVTTLADAAPATRSERWPARCFDILQKASLEHVSDDETAFLREACR